MSIGVFNINKNRFLYALLSFITILFGLASRSDLFELPVFIATYAGDTLWALMVYWLIRFLAPSVSVFDSAVAAVLFAFAIEFSQLYHAQWIDNIRGTTLGALVLGFGFKLSDLVCYSVGILFGMMCDYFVLKQHGKAKL